MFIVGESGSGKTTLLNLIGLLDKPDKGEIFVDSKCINKFKQKEVDYYRNTYIGFVFQEYNLINKYDVGKNVALALDLQKKKKYSQDITNVLTQVGLNGLEKRKISELFNEFETKYTSKLSEVIVNENFFESLNLQENVVMSTDFYKIAYVFNSNRFYPNSNTALLNKEITIYNGNEIKKINSLADNELVLGTGMLDELYDNEYSNKLLEYLNEKKSEYDLKVKERDVMEVIVSSELLKQD